MFEPVHAELDPMLNVELLQARVQETLPSPVSLALLYFLCLLVFDENSKNTSYLRQS